MLERQFEWSLQRPYADSACHRSWLFTDDVVLRHDLFRFYPDQQHPLTRVELPVLMLARPSIKTNAYGGRSSSTHNATRGSRSTARPLTDVLPVVISRSSPSSTNHTGTTWGRPSVRLMAHFRGAGARSHQAAVFRVRHR